MVVIDNSKAHPSSAPTLSVDELPPSYVTAVAAGSRPTLAVSASSSSQTGLSTSAVSSSYPFEKRSISSPQLSNSPSQASSSTSAGQVRSPTLPPIYPAGWLGTLIGTPQAKADQEVRLTVLGLLQGIIKQGDSSNALPIIQSCYDACLARGLSFESIAQEPSVQGHTPLYWTIVKGVYANNPNAAASANLTALFDILLSFPLTPATYADALQACLLTSSHATFLRLRKHDPKPVLRMPGDEDDSLASDGALNDFVSVTNGEDVEAAMNGAFRVDVTIKDFQKRMRLFKHIPIEFIARGRMWALTFIIAEGRQPRGPRRHGDIVKPGAWLVSLDLIEKSPATWLDSRLTIGTPPTTASPSTPSSPTRQSTLRAMLGGGGERELLPIVFRMRSPGVEQIQGDGGGRAARNKLWIPQRGEVTVSLSDHVCGNSLEFDGCPYLSPDGSLSVLLEAKLVKPKENNPDCVFM